MVVSRRAPAPPPPPGSRSASAQPVYAIKSRPESRGTTSNTSETDTSLSNSAGASSTTADTTKKGGKGKQKSKHKKGGKRERPSSSGFSDLLAGFLFVWFTIYSLAICPNDTDLERPVCKGLYEYRRLILEPYIFPPIQAALAHPSVAPHIQTAKPYVAKVVSVTQPIAIRTQYEWNKRVAPQWNKDVIPQWNARVVPELRRLDKTLAPYRARVAQEYQRRVAPHARVAMYNLQRWQRQAQPYVILAANKMHHGYLLAKPYAIPAWKQFQAFLQQLVSLLLVQRRRYVDPHVARIWEQVKESSTGKASAAAKAVATPSIVIPEAVTSSSSTPWSSSSASAKSASSSVSLKVASHSSSMSSAVVKASSFASSTGASSAVSSAAASKPSVLPSAGSVVSDPASASFSSAVVSPASTLVESISSSVSSTPSSHTPETSFPTLPTSEANSSESSTSIIDHAVSIPAPRVVPASSGASAAFSSASDGAASVASDVVDAATSSLSSMSSMASSAKETVPKEASSVILHAVSSLSSAASSPGTEVASSASSISSAWEPVKTAGTPDRDLDADSFLADLGISDDLTDLESGSEALEANSQVHEETEEERAERLREEEENRQRKMQETAEKRADIDKRHSNWEQDLDATIKDKSKELRKALVAIRKAATAELKASSDIQGAIEAFVAEGEKLLKGAEGYFKNLKKETRGDDEKATLWDRVVEKVNDKFTQKLRDTESVVNMWYSGVSQQEVELVKQVTGDVLRVAENAQADVGLDYVWLDDVTYHDWQRYHDLIRRSENFAATAYSIQNGTHPQPPANPVMTALGELENEVDDVIKGFETRLRRIKRTGDRAFRSGTVEDIENDFGAEPEVSILPTDPVDPEKLADAPPPIAIGRGAQEVKEAMQRAGSEAVEITEAEPPVHGNDDPVKSIIREAEAEAKESDPLHLEL